MRKTALTVLLLCFSSGVALSTEITPKACVKATAPKSIRVADASGGTIQNVLCCCQNIGGGQCCKYVATCFGYIIPGCMCSQNKQEPEPAKPQP